MQSRTMHFKWGRRVPILLQAEAAECGLACLAMISGYFGHETDLFTLRQKFSLSLKGMTLSRLIEMAGALGFQSRALRVELEGLRQLRTPCVLHWNMNHFVVLSEIRANQLVVHDPAVGERTFSLAEASRHFTGVALEVSPGPDFKPKSEVVSISLANLTGNVHGLRTSLKHIFGFALILELFALATPLFVQIVADQVLADADYDLLTTVGLVFLVLALVQPVIAAIRSWSVSVLGANLNLAWTTNVFGHLVKLPEIYFQKRHLGDVVSRFNSINTIQQTVTTRFVEVILDGVMASFTLLMLLLYSVPLASLTILAFGVYALMRLVSFRQLRHANSDQIVASARQQSQFLETIRGSRTIRLYNKTAAMAARYSNKVSETLNAGIVVQRLSIVFAMLNATLFGVQRVATLWIGARMALAGSFTVGMLMAYLAYSDQFTARAATLVDYLLDLRMLRLQGERLADIVLSEPEAHVEGLAPVEVDRVSLELRNVSFRYSDGEPWVIQNCSFTVQAGESVAIVGPSGCGKTTLAGLMLGLLEPQEGTVLVGGADLHKVGKRAFRAVMGSVAQDDLLFAGTVADNISFFDSDGTLDRVQEAARKASVHDEIEAMPMGYYSLVGDMGSALSGGQKQRLLLARALYSNPKFLILDEATSHLDSGNEEVVSAAIHRMDITRIVIAHRIETIATTDRVLELCDGGVISTEVATFLTRKATAQQQGVALAASSELFT